MEGGPRTLQFRLLLEDIQVMYLGGISNYATVMLAILTIVHQNSADTSHTLYIDYAQRSLFSNFKQYFA